MLYYCKGKKCQRKDECLRHQSKEVKDGFATGVWLVNESDCMVNTYHFGVFYK